MRRNRNSKRNRNSSYTTPSKNLRYMKTFESFGRDYELLLEEEGYRDLLAGALMVLATSPSFAGGNAPDVSDLDSSNFIMVDGQQGVVSDTLWDEEKKEFVRSISMGSQTGTLQVVLDDAFTGKISVQRSTISKELYGGANSQEMVVVYAAKNIKGQQEQFNSVDGMRKGVSPYFTYTSGDIQDVTIKSDNAPEKVIPVAKGVDASGSVTVEINPGDRSETKPLMSLAGNSRNLDMSINIQAFEDSDVVFIYRGETIRINAGQSGQSFGFRHVDRTITPKTIK